MTEPKKGRSYRKPRAPKLTVCVTEAHIDLGVPRDSGFCIFAEAIKSTFPDAKSVAVDLQTIRFTDPKKGFRYAYLTPRVCQVAIINFDQGHKPAPFTFRLRAGQVTPVKEKRSLEQKAVKNLDARIRRAAARETRERDEGERVHATIAPSNDSGAAGMPEKIGGQLPPLQKTRDGVPFSRRRAFGLKALSG